MSQQKYSKAYEAYQQAVYRDGRNPTFWCSIGVLYYQINQYRDALDAYSRAIRLNPYISEVWYDLGTLVSCNSPRSCSLLEANASQYESCNNQTADALDAYQRAFDLDPSNMHIKARLQLLRNNGQSTGMPNQQNAPVPQDVHPQQYQAAGVGAPPGPQWGVPSGPTSVLHGTAPTSNGSAPDWSRRLADIPNPTQPPAQPANIYDQREPLRAPLSQRQMSPRQEQMRQYQEQHRHTPIRRPSPPPHMNHNGPITYSAPQALPQPQPSIPQPLPNRIPNPNYGAPDANLRLATSVPTSGPVGPGPRAPYGRGDSPPPEIRPIAEPRPASPGLSYPQQQYQHHPNTSQAVGIAAGAPPPMAALAAAEAAARESHDRPIIGFKRGHESDEEYKVPNKHPTNGENRSRLEDIRHRRPSPPDRKASPRPRQVSPRGRPQSPPYGRPASPPPSRHSRSSSAARRDEQRRADENYHPSEAAHHPQTLPSMQPQQPPPVEPPQTPASETGRDERRETYEAAARKMEVDEDYDDDGEDQKRKEERNSPQHSQVNGQPPKVEIQA